MKVVCLIYYRIDPFQHEAFEEYAVAWRTAIPRCGGNLIGYFMPYEGTNDVAYALIGFDSLASYETYRSRLREDPSARANFEFAKKARMILSERRTFVRLVE